jgi:CHASE1-domain containing sensor protein
MLKPLKHKRHIRWLVFSILFIGTFLTIRLSLWSSVKSTNSDSAEKAFSSQVGNTVSQLNKQVEIYANTLYAGRALFMTTGTVSRQDWTTFVEAQKIKQRYPAVYALAYASAVNRKDAAALTNQINANRLPSETKTISIFPDTNNDDLAVLTYIAPNDASQKQIGYDLYSNSERKNALLRARDSGLVQASKPLVLLADSNNPASSVLFDMPVYKPATMLSTVGERRAALSGYVILATRTKPLIDGAFQPFNTTKTLGLSVSVDGKNIYNSFSKAKPLKLHQSTTINVAGQIWMLKFDAPKDYGLNATSLLAPSLIFWSAFPMVIILLLALYFAMRVETLKLHHSQHHPHD